MSLFKNIFCFCIFYLFLIFASYANATEFDNKLFPSKNCIAQIIKTDELIKAEDCLVFADEIDGIYKLNALGDPILKFDFEDDYGHYFLISYYKKSISGAIPHWVLTIDYSMGGSGLYSVLMVLIQTNENLIKNIYVENRGDRCADGFVNLVGLSSADEMSALTTRGATLFRIFNPKDNTNWWNEKNITMFEDMNDEEVRVHFNKIAKYPLFKDQLPFFDISHCFNCCAGHVLYEQSLTTRPLSNGKLANVIGIIFNIRSIDTFSKLEGINGCLAKSVSKHINEFSDYSSDKNLKYLHIDKWSILKNEITRHCFN